MIVGEVEFYVLSCGEEREANFFGTDFNYATSKLFRDKFRDYTTDLALIDIGYREDSQPDDSAVSQGNDDNLRPVVPIHRTDKIAFPKFMRSLQRQVNYGHELSYVLRI